MKEKVRTYTFVIQANTLKLWAYRFHKLIRNLFLSCICICYSCAIGRKRGREKRDCNLREGTHYSTSHVLNTEYNCSGDGFSPSTFISEVQTMPSVFGSKLFLAQSHHADPDQKFPVESHHLYILILQ